MNATKMNNTAEIVVGDQVFYVRKFPALTAARISANVLALLAPLLGGAGGLLGSLESEDGENVFDADIGSLLPSLASSFSSLEGKKMEIVLKELLLEERLISIDSANGITTKLTQDLLDEIFCGDLMGLLTLAYEVIKLNYGSLFTMLGNLSGSRAFTPPKSLV
jgi:hypothetical protein